jgi:uncharacterized membrane protein YhiD involved in acid resistance
VGLRSDRAAAGTGYYSAALMTTLVSLFLLWPMRIVARRLFDRPHTHRLEVRLAGEGGASAVLDALERIGVRVMSFDVTEGEGGSMLDLLLDLPRGVMPETVVRRLFVVTGVRSSAWRDE